LTIILYTYFFKVNVNVSSAEYATVQYSSPVRQSTAVAYPARVIVI